MNHHTAHICAVHKAVQLQCKCPEPITQVIEEECKHGELTDRSLFWNGTRVVRGPIEGEKSDLRKQYDDAYQEHIKAVEAERDARHWVAETQMRVVEAVDALQAAGEWKS